MNPGVSVAQTMEEGDTTFLIHLDVEGFAHYAPLNQIIDFFATVILIFKLYLPSE